MTTARGRRYIENNCALISILVLRQFSKILWSTVSNTADRSNNNKATACLESMTCIMHIIMKTNEGSFSGVVFLV